MLKTDSLKGALIYYDGTFNDARMNLAIVLTAIRHGAKVSKLPFFHCVSPSSTVIQLNVAGNFTQSPFCCSFFTF